MPQDYVDIRILPNDDEEEQLFAHHLDVVDRMFRMATKDAPANAQRLLERYTVAAADAQKEIAQLSDRMNRLLENASRSMDRAQRISEITQHHLRKRTYHSTEGATPETKAKPKRANPVKALVALGHLTHDDERASAAILRCYEHASRGVMAKIRNYDTFIPPPKRSGRPTHGGTPTKADERHADIYMPWTKKIHETKALSLPFVFDIVVDGQSLDAARRTRRMSWDKGLSALKRALEIWGRMEADYTPRPRDLTNGVVEL